MLGGREGSEGSAAGQRHWQNELIAQMTINRNTSVKIFLNFSCQPAGNGFCAYAAFSESGKNRCDLLTSHFGNQRVARP